ncbi:MAG: class I SAM-dependent methyltransferase [Solirubrobacterales bacterium]|nr:class I SAM-dependent methyltransferase [Solirubrobacterales bacterium]
MSAAEDSERPPCRICGSATRRIGPIHGNYSGRDYELRRCEVCNFAFIADPWTEFERIYDDRYYDGHGADPLVDYRFELSEPARTIRRYEWRGVTHLVERLLGGLDGVRWLDFGCGNGGLVRYVLEHTNAKACGFEEGSIATAARRLGIPILSADALSEQPAAFDVVTAIEVIEHTLDPLTELRRIRGLLRSRGLLFLTTGNAAPFASDLARWSYIVPEIHVSFFEPDTLRRALGDAGFCPGSIPPGDGFDEILKFKVLKNLHLRRRSPLTDVIPARPVAALADRRVRLREHPIGWAA